MTQRKPRVDVTLLLESTYPYVRGGVSSWVHQLVQGLPDLRFAAVFLGSRRADYGGVQYQLPANLVHLEHHYLFETDERPPIRAPRLDEDAVERMAELHEAIREGRSDVLDIDGYVSEDGPLGWRAFLHSRPAWWYITEQYERFADEPSFVDYFWSVRNAHLPVWTLASAAGGLGPTRLLFSPSTGYAGLLGAFASRRHDLPLVVMEHGIYTKERRIDLMKAEWIRDNRNVLQRDPTDVSYLRELWVRFFEAIARLAYDRSDPIVSLFAAARDQQLRDGAPEERTRIVPNGVAVDRLAALRRSRGASVPPVICLLGRVVSIKDVKTFIRTAGLLRTAIPDLEAWIAGPLDEEPEYTEECRQLVRALDLGRHVHFLGFQQVGELLPHVGLLVLTSISEGLPLSVLEGFAAGIPAVTTDVGACPELIRGRGPEDEALGAAGRVVGLADPEATAAACHELLTDAQAYRKAARAAVERVERYYDRERMLEIFHELFLQRMRS